MDQLKQSTLVECGLTKNESKVYLALLRLGSATAIEVTKASKVHRVNVYDALERLREKGLISTILRAKKRIFEAANPEQLHKLVKQKEELLKQVMPQLTQEFKIKKEKQQVHHFFGPEGVMQSYYMILEQNQTIYALGGSGLNRKFLKHRFDIWNKERKKRGIKGKLLYYEFIKKTHEVDWEEDPTAEIRYLPDKYRSQCMVDVCGDLVINLLPIEDNIMAIVIENSLLADTYRRYFQFMWDHAKA